MTISDQAEIGHKKKKLFENDNMIKMADEFRDWGEKTTFHGVSIIFRARNLVLRIFWLLIFASSSTLCCLMIINIFTQYFNYEVITKIRIVPKKSLTLPSFIFCGSNIFSSTYAYEFLIKSLSEKYQTNISTYEQLLKYSKEFNVSLDDEVTSLQNEYFLEGLKNASSVQKFGYSIDEFFYK